MKEKELEIMVTDIILSVGIPANVKGFSYLRDAILTATKQKDAINAITKMLYPCVAKNFNTSSERVERAIRHAIGISYDRGKIKELNNLFKIELYGKYEKPTNGEFIALVANRMILNGY